jgi:regulator of PEP synthase PpsR (kinase-PPPase family)
MEHETDNRINFLDLTIKKDNGHLSFEIYRKPTCTDIIIPRDSCHPTEQKLSAIRYLHNRNNTYTTDQDSKQKEHAIINQILHNNRYDQIQTTKYTGKKPPTNTQDTKQKKWAKFTFIGKETRYITKLFKKHDINIAFMTKNNIKHLLQQKNQRDPYKGNGVYQLICSTCNKRYVGQTGVLT